MIKLTSWQMHAVGEPLIKRDREIDGLGTDEVLVRVAGCGVCHTDLGFLFDGVRPKHALPLTLGHEIAGVVEMTGESATAWQGKAVVVPAVIPCDACNLCRTGRGTICRAQTFIGSDVHGGFASHVLVPARGLCPVDETRLAQSGVELAELGVLADAISTPYQAIVRAGLSAGDVAVFVGVGGVGAFGVQIAHSFGARVLALDVDDARLARLTHHGADRTLNVRGLPVKDVRERVRKLVTDIGGEPTSWRIFETSGTESGQLLAFGLLTFGAILSVIGYQLSPIEVRLSNLMAFDAVAQGNWGCLPKYYPAALEHILCKEVVVRPFVETRPMSQINDVLQDLHRGRLNKRPILLADL